MANEQNLKPSEYKLTQEEAKKGGINSGISRRRKKAFRDILEKMLEEDGGILNGEQVSRKEMITARALNMLMQEGTADKDFLKAFEIVRDTVGEKPIEKVMVSEVEKDIIEEVERIVLEED